jgi:hypothetical protein
MTKRITLVPAYGRDYKSKKAVLEDWNNNKDFQIADLFSGEDGRYANKQDLPDYTVNIRYKNLTQICVINQ